MLCYINEFAAWFTPFDIFTFDSSSITTVFPMLKCITGSWIYVVFTIFYLVLLDSMKSVISTYLQAWKDSIILSEGLQQMMVQTIENMPKLIFFIIKPLVFKRT